MHEIEIKILDVDRKKTEKRLIELGAIKVFDDEMRAVYFDSAERTIEKNRGTFRLRKQGDVSVLTFKARMESIDAKVMEEKEVGVSDFDTIRSIIESIGFLSWLEMEKHRTTYELAGLHFEFDKYHGAYEYIPEFLEIEGTDLAVVYTYAEILGFRKDECRPWDAVQVADHYLTVNRKA